MIVIQEVEVEQEVEVFIIEGTGAGVKVQQNMRGKFSIYLCSKILYNNSLINIKHLLISYVPIYKDSLIISQI